MKTFNVLVAISGNKSLLQVPTDLELIGKLDNSNGEAVKFDDHSDIEVMSLEEFQNGINDTGLDASDFVRFVKYSKVVETKIEVIE